MSLMVRSQIRDAEILDVLPSLDPDFLSHQEQVT